ncbi:fumarate hydratase [Haliovirga abyssi]|uniref:Fumarate hydratase n=1 Tax=Haliovirga abyssi TaxID=2996794 RepID=A0AAU9DG04_9FUSO|nr:fumarate hydratase [Haliovirga abyssi]BDU50347.1 fumarate hydratase [Haliovirga abyssi]
MRIIETSKIVEEVEKLCINSNYYLGEDIIFKYKEGITKEESETGKEIFEQLYENAKIAKDFKKPICQDTGMAVVFVELGEEVHINGNLETAINEGVAKGYKKGYLRKSIVKDPLFRENTNDNTPAVIHISIVKGDKLKIVVAPKGFGSENMSQIKMFPPAAGVEGIKEFVLKVVEEAGPNPCPPIIVGVGIGGNFEHSALLAKKALLRNIGDRNKNSYYSELEIELLEKINRLGIGPQGFGGKITALDLFIETYPTHIAGMPVAVNIGCHVNRHKEVLI